MALMLFSLFFVLPSPALADGVLAVPEAFQEHSQWCWAGSASGVFQYYGKNVTQCAMANYAWSRSDCCGSTTFNWNHACNQSNSMFGTSGLQGILAHWGVNSAAVYSHLAQSTVVSEINAGRPFVLRYGWTGGGGHFLVGRGIQGNNVYIMDPWPGNGYTISTYSSTVSSSSHNWTHSLRLTTNPATAKAAVTSLWGVSNAKCNQTSTLWAKVKNTGSVFLPSSAQVWFYVQGPNVNKYVGYHGAAGLNPGNEVWFHYNWKIPANAKGTYKYWARVWDSSKKTWLSDWSSPQTFTVACVSLQASVISLWDVSKAECGKASTLWARVQNTGTQTLPTSARVYYYVSGPSFSSYVGSLSVGGISSGAALWKGHSWTIPSTFKGTYTYWARVWDTSKGQWISAWSTSKTFVVSCGTAKAEVTSLWPVSNAQCGKASTLWAQVKNTGSVTLPSSARVYYYVSGPGIAAYVGSVSVSGISPGSSPWRGYNWNIPSSAKGTYTYWARVWDTAKSQWLSARSTSKSFTVTCSTTSCYEENFNDGQAQGWIKDESAAWTVTSNWYRAYKSMPTSATELMFSFYGGKVFKDGQLDVDMYHPKAKELAQYVYLRATKNFDYRVGATNSGSAIGFGIDMANSSGPSFGVWKYINGSPQVVKNWTASSHIKKEGINHVTVRAIGSKYTFSINGQQVFSGTDTSFSSGYIGLGGWTSSTHKETHWFDNVKFCPYVTALGEDEAAQTENLEDINQEFETGDGDIHGCGGLDFE